jgi:predicted nucleotidyltransferase
MIKESELKQIATRIGIAANAERVVLFGSHARGEANENSDVDLMIIADSNLPRFKRSRKLYTLLKPYPFAMDLLVYTPQEVEKGKRSPVTFISMILKEGKTLYVRRD